MIKIDPTKLPDPKIVAQAEIDRLEEFQLRKSLRATREDKLKEMEAYALTTLGLTKEHLYIAASQPNAATAFKSYKELKDLDNQIAALRAML